MSNDLLFSVLPRRGTVPVKGDRGEVKKIVKKMPLHASPEEENLPIVNPREQRQQKEQQQQQGRDYSDEHVGLIVDTTDEAASLPEELSENLSENGSAEPSEHLSSSQNENEHNRILGDDEDTEHDRGSGTHLDIEV